MLRLPEYYLSLNARDVYLWRFSSSAGLRLQNCFTNDEAGLAAFRQHLAQRPKARYHLLLDTPDELYVIENIPALSRLGRSRSAIVSRLLNKHAANMPLRAIFSQGFAVAAGRRNERLLIHAVPHNELTAPWINALEFSQSLLAGIHSFSCVAEILARQHDFQRGILLTLHKNSFRQNVINDGRLCLSRLITLPYPARAEDVESYAQHLRAETLRLHTFLISSNAFKNNAQQGHALKYSSQPLPVLVFAGEKINADALAMLTIEDKNLSWQLADPYLEHFHVELSQGSDAKDSTPGTAGGCNTVTAQQGIALNGVRAGFGIDTNTDVGTEALYVKCFAASKRLPSLDGGLLTLADHARRWRQHLLIAGMTGVAASACFAFFGYQNLQNAQQELLIAQEAARRVEMAGNLLLPSPLAASGNNAISAAALSELLALRKALPMDSQLQPQQIFITLSTLSRVMEQNPNIQLNSINWKKGDELRIAIEGWIDHAALSSSQQVVLEGKRHFEQFLASLQTGFGTQIRVERRPFQQAGDMLAQAPLVNDDVSESEGKSDPQSPSQFALEIQLAQPAQALEKLAALLQ